MSLVEVREFVRGRLESLVEEEEKLESGALSLVWWAPELLGS
jgi:hypothetical protein